MNLEKYWHDRGKIYLEQFRDKPAHEKAFFKYQEESLLNLVKSYSFSSILEVGCGFGRFTKILSENFKPERYVALDLSPNQIEKAKKYVQDERINFICKPIQDFESEEKFDLVFASEVLMHISFSDIGDIIKKLASLSANKIITIDWFDNQNMGKDSGGYCFMHDYEQLFLSDTIKTVKIHRIKKPISTKINDSYRVLRGRKPRLIESIIEATKIK